MPPSYLCFKILNCVEILLNIYKICLQNFKYIQEQFCVFRATRRQSLSEIGFGRIDTYTKLDKLGEVSSVFAEVDNISQIVLSIVLSNQSVLGEMRLSELKVE